MQRQKLGLTQRRKLGRILDAAVKTRFEAASKTALGLEFSRRSTEETQVSAEH